MIIIVCGISHKTAPVDIREKISFPTGILGGALALLRQSPAFAESIILSTCNRVELYAVIENFDHAGDLVNFICDFHHIDAREFRRYFYHFQDEKALEHLQRVASGLESMVLGERQILGQVKHALDAANTAGCAGPILQRVFSESIKTGRHVRNATKISEGCVSIGSVCVDLAKKQFKNFPNKQSLIIGAGKMGEMALRYLVGTGLKKIFIMNRTFAVAQDAATRTGGAAVPFEELPKYLKTADLVITSMASPDLLIKKEMLDGIMKERRHPLIFVDIAVPRNIDPDVSRLYGVSLFTIDDLNKVKDDHLMMRSQEAGKAQEIIRKRLEQWRICGSKHYAEAV
jgi:glutamyl-tRNA reductase